MTELNTEQLTQLYEEWSAMGEKRERERIIKLLEDCQITTATIFHPETFEPMEIKVRSESVRADLLIALIEGENK